MQAKTFLITGATGFFGSALAASLLAKGASVVAPSRRDADGARTTSAILAAARGFGFALEPPALARLRVVDCDFADPAATLTRDVLAPVDEVWHAAAEMSYALAKVQDSFRANVTGTTRLYSLVRDRAPRCARFTYVSTAYTAGMDGGDVDEELHFAPNLINAYQISKWGAEHALANLARSGALPVTIFRPTAIIGHRTTGFTTAKSFGYAMFIRAFWEAARAKVKELTFDVNPDARFDGNPIDEVVRAAHAFASRAPEAAPRDLEIVHASNPHQITTREHFEAMGEVVGVKVAFGAPKTAFDRGIDEVIAINRGFASGTWRFRMEKLRRVVGSDYCARAMSGDEVRRIIGAYVELLERTRGPSSRPDDPSR